MVNMSTDSVTNAEAAEILGISPNTLNVWRSRGEGPSFVPVGTHIRYMKADLQAWLDERIAQGKR